MKTETREIYKCDHCRKAYQVKRFAEYHELICSKNPDNDRPCYSCTHLIKKEAVIYSGHDNYFTSEPVNVKRYFCYCKKKDIFMFTPKNAIKGNFDHIDEDGGNFENHPMPKECDLRSDYE